MEIHYSSASNADIIRQENMALKTVLTTFYQAISPGHPKADPNLHFQSFRPNYGKNEIHF